MSKSNKALDHRLLVPRAEAASMLSTSVATIIRLENDGILEAVKLSRGQNSRTYYRLSDVQRLAFGRGKVA
jgi:hypothetical protein